MIRVERGAQSVERWTMTVRQQWMIVGAVVALLGAGLFAGVKLFADDLFPVAVGSAAPTFKAKDVA